MDPVGERSRDLYVTKLAILLVVPMLRHPILAKRSESHP
jgi:hypothetical protein